MNRHHAPRVAFDTAVVLRALLLNDAKSKQLRRAWQTGQCQALVATESAQALMQALAFPAFKLDQAQQLELLADFLPYAEVVGGQGSASAEGSSLPLLTLARSAASAEASLDHVVSDCPKLRSSLVRYARDLKQAAFSVLGSEEFLAQL
ncbi:PIN domain-containing protein [Paucibacter sp. B2R-40]|uniref:PIN domain-containing protein n=1 Tax=Paucibacter sp. B2R-40 TaxID=2893554 RepID=UPI0021E4BE5D|nr:PIN domain-containing protein [Paucibacter sp. B2R-40]MCV2352748.1 PIN domain-containing protein [Paucibacter sp. B2R-40]